MINAMMVCFHLDKSDLSCCGDFGLGWVKWDCLFVFSCCILFVFICALF